MSDRAKGVILVTCCVALVVLLALAGSRIGMT